jgi:hypothetical protein
VQRVGHHDSLHTRNHFQQLVQPAPVHRGFKRDLTRRVGADELAEALREGVLDAFLGQNLPGLVQDANNRVALVVVDPYTLHGGYLRVSWRATMAAPKNRDGHYAASPEL